MPKPRYLIIPLVSTLAGIAMIFAINRIIPPPPNPDAQVAPSATPQPAVAVSPRVSGEQDGKSKTQQLKNLATGEMAAFTVSSEPKALPDLPFQDSSGNDLTLKDFNGKVVLLNLWATWCAPCLHEMPTLDRLQKALGSENFEVVALSIDIKGARAARKMLDRLKVKNLKLYIDQTTKAARTLSVRGMPTTILMDASGRELGRLSGPANWDSPQAMLLIEAAVEFSK